MKPEDITQALQDLAASLAARQEELQNKMRELGSAAAEVNQLRIQVVDLLNKVKSTQNVQT